MARTDRVPGGPASRARAVRCRAVTPAVPATPTLARRGTSSGPTRPAALPDGALIRAIVPGHIQRRQYRIETTTPGITLREMWCDRKLGEWVASQRTISITTAAELGGLELISFEAPRPGAAC